MKYVKNFFLAIWHWLKFSGFLLLCNSQQFRIAYGGHWEKWDVHYPVEGTYWYPIPKCSRDSDIRPLGYAQIQHCEDWPDISA